ncbi:MAG: TIGR04086 family membrane protein [Eubacteriales bacterium]|nr:TIGR04086 family membrane protein [Eubacteriales bacterium]
MNQTGITSVFGSLFVGLAVVFGGTLLCACAMSGGKLDAESGRMAAYGCLAAGCILASFLGARKADAKKLLLGFLPSLCLLGCLFLLALSWKGQTIQSASAAMISGICLLGALIGAMPGTLIRTKHK